ncbi:hypothetical protein HYQ45_011322 [Verticillium longisporum]|uniref:BZIP domain-containing protein n=1 Tax=Verticillium longisporum TaxID=100787 RepID=A0A8I2ZIB3_VERLO|nr:hypothetical protein HYQ45_011322 [Verticillium longisporum]
MKNMAALDMVDADVLLDFDSRYGYDETDQCLNSSATCRTANSMSSAFDISTMSHMGSSDTLYPSPLSSRRVTASPQPMSTDPPERSTDEAYASSSSVAASIATAKPTAKRKRENRYKNAAPSVLSRRRAQNRASQRAYRERKDQRIKDLELMLSEQKEKSESLGQAYANLHAEYSWSTSHDLAIEEYRISAYLNQEFGWAYRMEQAYSRGMSSTDNDDDYPLGSAKTFIFGKGCSLCDILLFLFVWDQKEFNVSWGQTDGGWLSGLL